MASGKKTKGRQKIEIKLIEKKDDRMITFSKRRAGINKKLSEIATLCGAEVAFLVFSPTGKPFSFAHPSMETVINHFLGRDRENANLNDNTQRLVSVHRQLQVYELNQQYDEAVRRLDAEKNRMISLEKSTKNKKPLGWWDASIDNLHSEELKELYTKYVDLRAKLLNTSNERNADSDTIFGLDASGANLETNLHASAPGSSVIDYGINPFAPGTSSTNPPYFGLGASQTDLAINYLDPGSNVIDSGIINPFAPGTSNNDPAFFGLGSSQIDLEMNYFAPGSSAIDPGINSFAPGTSNINPAFFGLGASQTDLVMNYSVPGSSTIDSGINSFAPGTSNNNPAFFGLRANQSDLAMNNLAPETSEISDDAFGNIVFPPQAKINLL